MHQSDRNHLIILTKSAHKLEDMKMTANSSCVVRATAVGQRVIELGKERQETAAVCACVCV